MLYSISSRGWQWLVVAAFTGLLALGAWSFSSGLGGGFIFDDEANLKPAWSRNGDIDTFQDVIAFATSANELPGRPLSLLSMLVDDQSWPADIPSLKRTNLALHLLNGCLVFWLCLALLRRFLPTHSAPARAWLALFACALWVLHPLQVSNVSYIIQRMNQLSTLLQLAGLLLYLHGREALPLRPLRGLVLCSTGIGVFMPLAILAKENGLLLCAFALLVDAYCFRPLPLRWWPAWKAVFLWGPLLAFAAYCLYRYKGFMAPYPTRNFDAWERLLTQGPVLLDYLDKLLLPRLHGAGLFYDNFPVARHLLDPAALTGWAVVLGLLGLAWILRKRMPPVSFGIFFYFAGHLMESTLLPLELYFEHRNYLPQLGLWLALAGLLAGLQRQRLRYLLAGAAVVLVLVLAWMTRQNAALWSQTRLQAAVWYESNPGSLRTTMFHSNQLVKHRQTAAALRVLDRSQELLPDALVVALAQTYVRCYLRDEPVDFSALARLAPHARYETASFDMLEMMWDISRQPGASLQRRRCRPASAEQLAAIYHGLLANPRFQLPRARAKLYSTLAADAARRRDLAGTIAYYDQAFASEANPIFAFEAAVALLSAGLPEAAQEYSVKARHSLTLRMRLFYPMMETNLDTLDRVVRQQLVPAGGAGAPAP